MNKDELETARWVGYYLIGAMLSVAAGVHCESGPVGLVVMSAFVLVAILISLFRDPLPAVEIVRVTPVPGSPLDRAAPTTPRPDGVPVPTGRITPPAPWPKPPANQGSIQNALLKALEYYAERKFWKECHCQDNSNDPPLIGKHTVMSHDAGFNARETLKELGFACPEKPAPLQPQMIKEGETSN